jgi:cell division protein FtsI/penicillin-binding protein 2
MATSISTVANGGTLWQPFLGQSLIDPVTNQETALPHPSIRQGFISAANLQVVREGMRMTVESGSARPLNLLKVQSAGKTGTAQFGNQGLTHAWYVGYAPYDHPHIAFAILIEGGGESFYSSVPVAEEILRGYFNEPLAEGQDLFSNTQVPADFQGEH